MDSKNFEDLGRNMGDGFQYNGWEFEMTVDLLDHENSTEEEEDDIGVVCCSEIQD